MYLPKEKVVANHTFHKIHCNILSCRETMRSYELICLNTPHMWYVCYESAGRHTVDRKPSRPQKFHNQATLTTYVHCKLYEEVTVWCEGGNFMHHKIMLYKLQLYSPFASTCQVQRLRVINRVPPEPPTSMSVCLSLSHWHTYTYTHMVKILIIIMIT